MGGNPPPGGRKSLKSAKNRQRKGIRRPLRYCNSKNTPIFASRIPTLFLGFVYRTLPQVYPDLGEFVSRWRRSHPLRGVNLREALLRDPNPRNYRTKSIFGGQNPTGEERSPALEITNICYGYEEKNPYLCAVVPPATNSTIHRSEGELRRHAQSLYGVFVSPPEGYPPPISPGVFQVDHAPSLCLDRSIF